MKAVSLSNVPLRALLTSSGSAYFYEKEQHVNSGGILRSAAKAVNSLVLVLLVWVHVDLC